MKKILFVVAILVLLPYHTQAQSYCAIVDAANAFDCCDRTNGNYNLNKSACDIYENPAPGTVGNPATPPVNSSNNTGPTITSQTSASDLAKCSAIEFKSLLDMLIWAKCIIVVALVPLIFALAFFFFLWGIFRFIMASAKTQKEDAKKYILWGLIALFVMVSVWGIINLVGGVFGLDTSLVPKLQTEYLPLP